MLRHIASSKINNKPLRTQNMIFQLLWKKWKIELDKLTVHGPENKKRCGA